MLKIYTTVENGTAYIKVYSGERSLGVFYKLFATDYDAYQWLDLRGVRRVEDFAAFVKYALTKGSIGTKITNALSEEPCFILNGRVGVYELKIRNCAVVMSCRCA